MYLSSHVVNKGKQETSVGEGQRDNETRSDHENHEFQKALTQRPCMTKLDSSEPHSGPPGLLHGERSLFGFGN